MIIGYSFVIIGNHYHINISKYLLSTLIGNEENFVKQLEKISKHHY
jgi:hypothetical protein